jgi:AcrR family transcriptional regulator
MSTPPDRRSRKRLATKQTISDAATLLFIERGFDNVTIDDIAEAADVGRMTVFNHFPRKEDMFFDRDEAGREMLLQAIRERDSRVSPIEALRLMAHRMLAERTPYLEFTGRSLGFYDTVVKSETLKARARAIRDEIAQVIRGALTQCAGRDALDPQAHLASGMLLATWSVAFIQAHETFRRTRSTKEANTIFLSLIDQGVKGLAAAMAGTPYV